MNNPFEVIEARLSSIENLILDLKHNPKTVEPIEQPEKLLTIKEAAKFLNLTVPTIYSKVSKRELPYMKRCKNLYFSEKELMEYVKQGKAKTYAEIENEANTYLKNKGGAK